MALKSRWSDWTDQQRSEAAAKVAEVFGLRKPHPAETAVTLMCQVIADEKTSEEKSRLLYNLMINFVVAELHFYRDHLTPAVPGERLENFHTNNLLVFQQIFADGLKYFKYELSYAQMGEAVKVYTAPSYPLEKQE